VQARPPACLSSLPNSGSGAPTIGACILSSVVDPELLALRKIPIKWGPVRHGPGQTSDVLDLDPICVI
jgi:hypothetical protein